MSAPVTADIDTDKFTEFLWRATGHVCPLSEAPEAEQRQWRLAVAVGVETSRVIP